MKRTGKHREPPRGAALLDPACAPVAPTGVVAPLRLSNRKSHDQAVALEKGRVDRRVDDETARRDSLDARCFHERIRGAFSVVDRMVSGSIGRLRRFDVFPDIAGWRPPPS
jgi:hypothetical protein